MSAVETRKAVEWVNDAVAAAVAAGATAADAVLLESDGITVAVRDGEVETVQDSLSQGLGVRAFRGTRMGVAYTNDISPAAVEQTARRAAALAEVAAEDEAAGLPAEDDLGALADDLDMVDPALPALTADDWRDRALAAEAAAREDERITMSEGARAGAASVHATVANSAGFRGERRASHCFVFASVFATGEQGERQRAGYHTHTVHLEQMKSPAAVGREAARRAIERCGYRKPPTGEFPVIFSPEISQDFAATLAQAASAALVFRRGTFLADRLGDEIGSSALTLVDDATLPRRVGSRSFDGEGVRSRRTVVLDQGRLASWLADSYSARRCGYQSTGNASRPIGGSTSVGTTNLVLEPGTRPPEELIAEIDSGLYITDLFGFGVNLAAGAWSRGGSGVWIENGRKSYAVQELTVAGDLREMLRNVRELANDLEWSGSVAAPTMRVDGLTIAAG